MTETWHGSAADWTDPANRVALTTEIWQQDRGQLCPEGHHRLIGGTGCPEAYHRLNGGIDFGIIAIRCHLGVGFRLDISSHRDSQKLLQAFHLFSAHSCADRLGSHAHRVPRHSARCRSTRLPSSSYLAGSGAQTVRTHCTLSGVIRPGPFLATAQRVQGPASLPVAGYLQELCPSPRGLRSARTPRAAARADSRVGPTRAPARGFAEALLGREVRRPHAGATREVTSGLPRDPDPTLMWLSPGLSSAGRTNERGKGPRRGSRGTSQPLRPCST